MYYSLFDVKCMPSAHTYTQTDKHGHTKFKTQHSMFVPMSLCHFFVCTVNGFFVFGNFSFSIRCDSIRFYWMWPDLFVCSLAYSIVCNVFATLFRTKIEQRFGAQNRSIEQFWVNLFYSFIQPRYIYTRISACKIYFVEQIFETKIITFIISICIFSLSLSFRPSIFALNSLSMLSAVRESVSICSNIVDVCGLQELDGAKKQSPLINALHFQPIRFVTVLFSYFFHDSMDAVLDDAWPNCFILSNEPFFGAQSNWIKLKSDWDPRHRFR